MDIVRGGCGFLFFLFFCGIFGGVFTFFSAGEAFEYFGSDDWQTINGTVLESYISESRDEDGTTYKPVIIYEYAVFGQTYTSDRLQFGGGISSSNRRRSAEAVNNYPVGSNVEIYYNPEDPQSSVLQREAFWALWIFLSIGLISLGVFVLTLFGGMGFAIWFALKANESGRKVKPKQAHEYDLPTES